MQGVKIWGWVRREEMETAQGSCVKMTLWIDSNTTGHLWTIEAGVRKLEVEA